MKTIQPRPQLTVNLGFFGTRGILHFSITLSIISSSIPGELCSILSPFSLYGVHFWLLQGPIFEIVFFRCNGSQEIQSIVGWGGGIRAGYTLRIDPGVVMADPPNFYFKLLVDLCAT